MANVETLGLAIDSEPVKDARDELGRFASAADKADKSAGTLEDTTKGATNAMAGYRQQMVGSTQATSALTQEAERQARQQAMVTREVERATEAYRQSMRTTTTATSAANDNGKAWKDTNIDLAATAGHLKLAAAAAYVTIPAFRGLVTDGLKHVATGSKAVVSELNKISPAAGAAGSGVLSSLGPAFSFMTRLAIPIFGVVAAIKAMIAITELGEAKFKELNELATNAMKAGVGVEFYQRQIEAAKTLKVETSSAADAMKKFADVSASKGGEGVLEKRIAELQKLGNFQGNTGVAAFGQATTVEERFKAISKLISEAMAKGERLAALDLAEKFLPPDMLARLKASSDFLEKMAIAADNVKPAKLATQEDVDTAVALKMRLEEAERVLAEKWLPIQRDLTQLGLNYKESWVTIIEYFANGVGYLNDMYVAASGIAQKFAEWGNADFFKNMNKWMEEKGLMSTPESMGIRQVDLGRDAAERRLASGLRNPLAIQRAQESVTATDYKLFPDKSKMKKPEEEKENNKARDSFDQLERSILRTAAAHEADARSMGMSVGQIEKLRSEAKLLEVAQFNGIQVMKDGKVVNQEYYDRIQKAAGRAGQAVHDLELARIQNATTFERATMGMSQTEQAIAKEMQKLWGKDWPNYMESAEASAMRLNATLKETKDITSDALKGFVADLRAGKSWADAFKNSLDKLATKVINKFIDKMVDAAFMGKGGIGGVGIGGINLGGIFGSGTASTTALAPQPGTAGIAVVGHGGGTGSELGQRVVNIADFRGAPKHHSGRLAPGEKRAIIKDDENILKPSQLRAVARAGAAGNDNGPSIEFHTHNAPGVRTTSKAKRKPDGGMRIDMLADMVEDRIAGGMASGGSKLARTTSKRFGLNVGRGNSK